MKLKDGTKVNLGVTQPEYRKGDKVVSYIMNRAVWYTKTACSKYALRAGVFGVPYARGQYELCPTCQYIDVRQIENPLTKGGTFYVVYSYNTVFFAECQHCGHRAPYDVAYYSQTSRYLQQHLAKVFPDYAKLFYEQLELEKEARLLWYQDRAKGLTPSTRIVGMHGDQPVHARTPKVWEMMKYMKEKIAKEREASYGK